MRIDKHFFRIYFIKMSAWSSGFSKGFQMAGDPWSPGFSFGFGPLAIVAVGGITMSDRMQLLGYSSVESLFYDESDTQDFYLLRKPPLVTSTILYKVSPLFARDWLVFSGAATNWVYNPFGTSPYSTFSNTV